VNAATAPGATVPVHVVRAGDTAWDAWLRDVPRDIFHTAGYHEYARGSREGEPFLAVVGDRSRGLAWPYLMRPVAEVAGLEHSRATDVHSVYGYPGPLAWGCEPGDPFLAAAFARLVGVWREQGAVSAFTRFHPLLANANLLNGLAVPGGSGGVVAGGQTVSLDLRNGMEAARAGYAPDLRRSIRLLRQSGMVTIHDTDWRYLETFGRLYRETMVRSNARQYYFFSDEDFLRLRATLGDRLHLLVTLLGDDVAAAGLFTEFGEIAEWYLVGTAAEHRQAAPAKLLVDDAAAWAHERGLTVLHLGGGRGGRDDTLMWFKGRFSPLRHPFHTGRWVLDRAGHDALVADRIAGAPHGTALEVGFFPTYRAAAIPREPHDLPERHRTPLAIRAVGPTEASALADLLGRIDTTYFRPHPMTPEQADRIANLAGRDVYLVGFADGVPVVYGMLRGWDEGYPVPSLGIGVRRDMERRGYGRAMMARLHEIARERGAAHVRLRVHPDNRGAAALYRELGYVEVGVDRSEVLMTLAL
jgi:ribosomal protein S18 acetylase RimI-like enzyme